MWIRYLELKGVWFLAICVAYELNHNKKIIRKSLYIKWFHNNIVNISNIDLICMP